MPLSWRGYGLVVVAVCACGDNGGARPDAGVCSTPPCEKTISAFQLLGPPAFDLLWILDNSAGTGPLQDALAAAFPTFVDALETAERLPSLHVGAISGDVGAGPYGISGCSGFGDDGQLQYAPRIPACAPPSGRFVENLLNADGSRQTNYAGGLSDALSCISKLGVSGCPYQQPLEAARRALAGDGTTTGFIRDDAYLALVFVTATDDCSAIDTSLFDPGTAALGPASTFRCFEHGVQCAPDAPRMAGTKTSCTSRETSALVSPVKSYVDYFKGLKKDPSHVFVNVIGGSPTPVSVDVATEPSLRPSCTNGGFAAAPAIRLMDLAGDFPNRSTTASSCEPDLSGSLVQLAQMLRTVRGHPCLPRNVTTPVRCRVEEIRVDGIDDVVFVRELPQCDNELAPESSGNLPCFAIVEDDFFCDTAETASLGVDFYPVTRAPADNIWVVTKCLVDALP